MVGVSMADLLRMQGRKAFLVHDGGEAVAKNRSTRPEVVVLDIGRGRLSRPQKGGLGSRFSERRADQDGPAEPVARL